VSPFLDVLVVDNFHVHLQFVSFSKQDHIQFPPIQLNRVYMMDVKVQIVVSMQHLLIKLLEKEL
jgi:hypothetical protein